MPFWILPRYPEPFSCALPNLQRFPCFNIQEKWDALLYKSSLERGRKPLVIEGKAPSSWRENNGKEIALPDRLAAQVRSKGKSSLLPPPALHHCCGSLQPPRSSSSGLSPAAQCCCGIGNLLWLRKIMGICFSKPKKSQTKFRREKKKVQNQLILLEKLLAFSCICHNSLWYFLVLWSENLSYHVYDCCFCGIAGGERWYSEHKQTDPGGHGKDNFPYWFESFSGDRKVRKFLLQNIEDI